MDKQQHGRGNSRGSNSQKPNKRDFYNIVVVAPNGTTIDEHDWKKVAGDKQGGDLRKALKGENRGWTPVRVFDEAAYEKARAEFRDRNKQSTQESRKSVIQQAFADADADFHPRIESVLRIVLQLMDPSNEKRTSAALRNVVRAIDSAMSDEARAKGKAKVAKGKDGGDKQDAGKQDADAKQDADQNSSVDGEPQGEKVAEPSEASQQ